MPDEGIEPPTFGLQNRCSTAELIRRSGAETWHRLEILSSWNSEKNSQVASVTGAQGAGKSVLNQIKFWELWVTKPVYAGPGHKGVEMPGFVHCSLSDAPDAGNPDFVRVKVQAFLVDF